MSKRLSGLNPLAYIGVEALTPPQMYIAERAPTIGDAKNFNLGDLWIDETNENLYVLVSLSQGQATWITTFGGATSSFDTDNGTANENNGNINIVGDGVIATSGSGDTVTIGFVQATDGQIIIGNNGQDPAWANLGSSDGSIVITEGASSIDLEVDQTVVIGNGTNGQLLIAGGTNPEWASLTSDGSIIITPGVNTLQITAPSATGLTDIDGDTGTATQSAGTVNIVGDGSMIETTGATNTLTVSILSGTDGQLIMGATGGPAAWGNLTSMGGTVVITEGTNSINLEATGGGSSGASTFITDSGNALQNMGDITVVGGNNISTSGAGQTVTINVSDTTNRAVQVGNASGSLTSLAVGTNGQVLIGSTGANPQFSTLTSSGGTISFTAGAGTLNLEAVGGGGGGGVIVTPFNANASPQTWTKNPLTKWVAVMGWNAGGGGGSGSVSGSGTGGTGGGCGAFFKTSGPATFFGSSETVIVGFGGTGGTGVTSGQGVAGGDGGTSRFGSIVVPLTSQPPGGTVRSIQGGEGGGNFPFGGGCGGAFYLDSYSLYTRNFGTTTQQMVPSIGLAGIQGNPPPSNTRDAAYAGGDGPNNYKFIYGLGTGGGAGGNIGSPVGGNGGDIWALDGSTILGAAGAGGAAGVAGGDGADQATTGGIIFGGAGGGGGGAQNGGTPAGRGGDGGFPGGGGGGGGGSTSGTSGAGGNGGDGFLLVIEWT